MIASPVGSYMPICISLMQSCCTYLWDVQLPMEQKVHLVLCKAAFERSFVHPHRGCALYVSKSKTAKYHLFPFREHLYVGTNT